MSDSNETEVSSTPWLDPDKAIEMTEEPYPPIGLRTFSQKGIGERPHLKKADLKVAEPVDVAAHEPVKKRTTKKSAKKGS